MNINPAVAEKITQSFIDGLKAGRIPWKRGWKDGKRGSWDGLRFVSVSVNIQTGNHYNGLNALILDSLNLELPVWGTFNQWKNKGLSVKKGEKSMPTSFWSPIIKDENGNLITVEQYNNLPQAQREKCTKFLKLRYDNLFHIGQVDGDKKDAIVAKWTAKFGQPKTDGQPEPIPTEPDPFHHELAEQIVSRWDVTVKHEDQSRAYYSPALDYIMMPVKTQFEDEAAYYETLFHEGVHASGHKKRLNRESLTEAGRFGDANYSFEELVAEIGSAYVCAHLNIEQDLKNKQAYINGWISKLGENPDWIIKAAGKATKAAGWVLGWLDKNTPTPIEQGDEE